MLKTTAILLMSLTLTLASCATSSTPTDTARLTAVDDAAAAAGSSTPDMSTAEQTSSLQNDNLGPSGTAEDGGSNAAPSELLSVQAISGLPKHTFDETHCASINGTYKTCVDSALLKQTATIPIYEGEGITRYLPLNEVVAYCHAKEKECDYQARKYLSAVTLMTTPAHTCAWNSGSRRLQANEGVRALKFAALATGSGLLLSAGSYRYGIDVTNGTALTQVEYFATAALIGSAYNEWAWKWLETPTFGDSGNSFVAYVLVSAFKVAAKLPAALHYVTRTGLAAAMARTCPVIDNTLERDLERGLGG
ncbi:hypothetical protein MF271_22235 (plasmid) [Deinococcus sp. KNUC1210]|uniref:hypothetical protein n=1 Tax=Deinococcus sp. KNUC1210 TaxID=2917691 RepID=UPI001EF11298|nr:hypothetical protein [Deinococcus sp. KNUC1210]ULH18192.1 hypothetical protein MF271_22235 [Deinococcus sp. KNUC1210]